MRKKRWLREKNDQQAEL